LGKIDSKDRQGMKLGYGDEKSSIVKWFTRKVVKIKFRVLVNFTFER
jgi:hypothetical protein